MTSSIQSKPRLPLRTAIIGLSSSAVTSWASSAHLPSLLTARGRKDFTITALCNSSVSAATSAIQAFNLPSSTKAYGLPADVASDADIDVVICATRVDKHYETVVDSIKAGKLVYVEWPVTSSVKDTEALVKLSKDSGSVVAVGLQGPWSPPVLKLKEILGSGKLGKVLSSDVRAYGGTMRRDAMPTGLAYFGEKAVGGNPITIGFGHMIDYVQSVLGDFIEGSTTAKTQIQFTENKTFDAKTKEVIGSFQSDVPDLIVVTGSLPSSDNVVENPTLNVQFRRGQPFKGEPALRWSINCEKGEIRLISPTGVSLQANAYDEPHSLQIYHFDDDSIEELQWHWDSEQEQVPVTARSVMKTLYAFAEGDSTGYTSLEKATLRAKQIDSWLERGKW